MTVGNKIVQCTQDSNGAWIIPDITTTYTASAGGSAVEFEGETLTAAPNGGLINVDKLITALTIGNRVMTGSKDANGAWVIQDASTTHTVSQGGSAVMVDGVAYTAASQGLVKVDASETSDESDGSSKGSGTGTQDSGATQTNEAQQSTSATGSDGAAAATNTDSSSSGAGTTTWSPAFLTLTLLSLYFCSL